MNQTPNEAKKRLELYDPTAIMFCLWETGTRPTEDQLRRARERVERQNWDFMRQSQYELAIIEIVQEDIWRNVETSIPKDCFFCNLRDDCNQWKPVLIRPRRKTKLRV